MFGHDLRWPKALAVAQNVAAHMMAGGTVTGVRLRVEDLDSYAVPADVLVVLVDNNACRFRAVREARAGRIPVVLSALLLDSMRSHTFLQGQNTSGPCLWCAAPDLCQRFQVSTAIASASPKCTHAG